MSKSLLIIVSDESSDSVFLNLFPTITSPANIFKRIMNQSSTPAPAKIKYNLIDDKISEFKYNKSNEKEGNIRVFYKTSFADTTQLENTLFSEIKDNLANHFIHLLGCGPISSKCVSNVCIELVRDVSTQIYIESNFFPFTINSIGDEYSLIKHQQQHRFVKQDRFVKKYYIVTTEDFRKSDGNNTSMNKIKMAYDALIAKQSFESYNKIMWEKFFKMKHVIGSDLSADFMNWWNRSSSQQTPPSQNIQESFVPILYHGYKKTYTDSKRRLITEPQINSLQVYCRQDKQDKNNISFYLYQDTNTDPTNTDHTNADPINTDHTNADPKLILVAVLLGNGRGNGTNNIKNLVLDETKEKINSLLDSFKKQGGRRYRRSKRMKITKRKNRMNRKTRRK